MTVPRTAKHPIAHAAVPRIEMARKYPQVHLRTDILRKQAVFLPTTVKGFYFMNNRDDEYLSGATREIHVPEYDTAFTDSSSDSFQSSPGQSGTEHNLNYYQRMRNAGSFDDIGRQNSFRDSYESGQDAGRFNGYRGNGDQAASFSGYRGNNYNDAPYDDEYQDDPSDDTYDIGDDYDFGFKPKKRRNPRPDRYDDNDSYGNHSGRGGRPTNDYDDDYGRRPRRKRRHPVRRFFLTLLGIILVLIVLVAVFLHIAFSRMNRVEPVADTTADKATEAAGVDAYEERGVMNILLVGEDAREGETQTRSDTMIICSLNAKTRQITLVSLMRDTYVPIAGTDYSAKLNAAYAAGGLETLDETVQENFGIDIDGNAVVDLDGFLEAITSVGNLDIDLTYDEATYMNANEGLGSSVDNAQVDEPWGLVEGVNSLTPEQALCYARMRYVGNSDWDRVNRQKKIIQAAFAKMKSNPFRMLKVMNQAAPSITTDMTDLYLTRACIFALLCGSDMNAATLPGDGMYYSDTIDGQSVLVPDLNACHKALISYLYGSSADDSIFKSTPSATPTPAPKASSDTGGTDASDNDDQTWTEPVYTVPDNSGQQAAPDTDIADIPANGDDGSSGAGTTDGTYDNGTTGTDNSGYDNSGTGNGDYDNSGYDNTGTDNSGYDGTGTDNSGYNDNGADNSGYDSSGTANGGYDNSGYDNTGTDTSGYDNAGDAAQNANAG